MSQEVILNGRTSNIAPDNALVINRPARFEPLVLNGLMPTDVNINGLTRPPVLNGCVLNLPLYHSALSNPGSFKSLDAYQHACSVTGALWTPRGRVFDGTDDIIQVAQASSINDLEEFTFSLWVKPNSPGNYDRLFSKESVVTSTPYFFLVWRSGGYLEFRRDFSGDNCSYIINNNPLVNLKWSYITVKLKDKVASILVNNSVCTYAEAVPGTGTLSSDAASDLCFGARLYSAISADFKGSIGEVIVYNRELTLAEDRYNRYATKWRYL